MKFTTKCNCIELRRRGFENNLSMFDPDGVVGSYGLGYCYKGSTPMGSLRMHS